MKNTLNKIKAEGKISKLEDLTVETVQSIDRKKKKFYRMNRASLSYGRVSGRLICMQFEEDGGGRREEEIFEEVFQIL